MERARPPALLPQSLAKLVIDHFAFQSVDVSTVRELESYGDRNYYFRGTFGPGIKPNEQPAPSEYVLKVLNWLEPRIPGLVNDLCQVMLHLRDRGYRCCYPVPAFTSGDRCPYSVLITEKSLEEYVSFDQVTPGDTRRESSLNCEQSFYDVLVLVYVKGQPMGKMKTPPSERLLYSAGQYVGGIDTTLQVICRNWCVKLHTPTPVVYQDKLCALVFIKRR